MKNKVTISVVISSFNGGSKIAKCIESVKGFADEIIVINNESTDDTLKVAQKYTSHVFTRPNNPMLNINKNYGFKKATGDWILNFDDDEQATPELAREIKEKIEQESDVSGYWIPRKNIIFGKWIENSIWWPDYQLRLFKNGKGKFEEKHVHEYIQIEGETEKLINPMMHDNYSSVSQFIQKMDRIYTESEVDKIISEGKKMTTLDAIRYPANDFLKTFFFQKGYKDGLHGLVLSLLQSCYALVVFAKVWEKQGFKEDNSSHFLNDVEQEAKRVGNEFSFWFLSEKIKKSAGPKKVLLKILKKNAESHSKQK